jgi:PAS domain S-box-containing protein
MFSFGAKARKAASAANASERQLDAQLKRAADVASNALMLIDRDFKITYMNESSRTLINKHREHFPPRIRDVDPDSLIGGSADIFHKNPAHQRRLVDDPSRLPHRADVRMGPLTFALCVNAAYDETGACNGYVFEWNDVTELRELTANAKGQIDAISKAQAVIEFTLDGHVITANENFLKVMGYSLNEIKGQHHSIFVEQGDRATSEYKSFWEKLGRGEYDAGQYKRIAKGGREVWLQASYNPILDLQGRPMKVVKYATDITEQKRAELQLQLAVQQTLEVIEAAQSNDLTRRIPMEAKTGELENLCAGVNRLLETMKGIVGTMLESSSTVASAASEIAAGANDLSQRTEQQASSLEETAASMEEMASTVKQNSDNAQQANQLSITARSIATDGGNVVSQAVDAMARIEQSSDKISEIIGVIDEIAFQTNLLALNAAVEAARAGDAGKGFAVVASEVRSLAQRTSVAAKDIKGLIIESGRQVKDGVKLVDNAGTSLREIVKSINHVADIVAEIAAASKEQATGVEEINKAVVQMDQMTQQNAALVEESAAASRTLQEEAQSMFDKMSAYSIGEAQSLRGLQPPVMSDVQKSHAKRPSPVASKHHNRRAPKAANGMVHAAAAMQVAQPDLDWKEF